LDPNGEFAAINITTQNSCDKITANTVNYQFQQLSLIMDISECGKQVIPFWGIIIIVVGAVIIISVVVIVTTAIRKKKFPNRNTMILQPVNSNDSNPEQ